MITLTGKKVSEGIAIGKLTFYKREGKEIRRIYVKDVEKEVQRFQKARQKAIQELKVLYDTAAKEVGDANAAIFEMQQTILDDNAFVFCSHLKMSMISKAGVTGLVAHPCDFYEITVDLAPVNE